MCVNEVCIYGFMYVFGIPKSNGTNPHAENLKFCVNFEGSKNHNIFKRRGTLFKAYKTWSIDTRTKDTRTTCTETLNNYLIFVPVEKHRNAAPWRSGFKHFSAGKSMYDSCVMPNSTNGSLRGTSAQVSSTMRSYALSNSLAGERSWATAITSSTVPADRCVGVLVLRWILWPAVRVLPE